jgi:hypothetical protein
MHQALNQTGINMVKKIKGKLTLTEDTTFDESIEVEGDIEGHFNLKVARDIVACNIDARNIDARNIVALDINARNIDACNIVARNIVALDIDARNIDACNIVACNIDARNIDACNIDARNIIALDIIFCETIKLKDKTKGKIKSIAVIRKRSELELKEWDSD